MDSEFEDLAIKYKKAEKNQDVPQQKEILEKMRNYLIEKNKGENLCIQCPIKSASYDDLLSMMEIIEGNLQKNGNLSTIMRINQTARNKYSKDNPYPHSTQSQKPTIN